MFLFKKSFKKIILSKKEDKHQGATKILRCFSFLFCEVEVLFYVDFLIMVLHSHVTLYYFLLLKIFSKNSVTVWFH